MEILKTRGMEEAGVMHFYLGATGETFEFEVAIGWNGCFLWRSWLVSFYKPMNPNASLVEFQMTQGEPYIHSRRAGGEPLRFLSLCREHYFCLSQIAQTLEISVTTLRKAFLDCVGISPKSWMTQQRVMLSIRLIREGKSLSDVTAEMNYSDYQHMAKEFRSVVDFTPKSMRKILKGLQVAS